jgi:beta-lactamase class A
MYQANQTLYSYHPQRGEAPKPPKPPKKHRMPRGLIVFCVIIIVAIIGGYFMARTLTVKGEVEQQEKQAQAAVPKPTTDTKLKAAWQAALDGQEGDVDIAVYNHNTGLTTQYGTTNGTFNTASIVKLSILTEVLIQNQAKGVTGLTDGQLASATPMIANSDNDSATALYTAIGGAKGITDLFQKLSMTSSASNKQGWGITQTTAGDQLKLLNAFAYSNSTLTDDSRQVISRLLNNVEDDQTWGVSGGLPDDINFELKNGWLPDNQTDDVYSNGTTWIVNSIGHVYGQGQDYTIAILTDGNPTEDIGIQSVEQLSTITWQTLVGEK